MKNQSPQNIAYLNTDEQRMLDTILTKKLHISTVDKINNQDLKKEAAINDVLIQQNLS